MSIVKLAALVCCIAVCSAQSDWWSSISCQYIKSKDCYAYGHHAECGTDGITYRNRCDFGKAHCANPNLHVYAYTACANVTVPGGTPAPGVSATPLTPVLDGTEAVLDFICIEISHEVCLPELDPICGSDLKTYDNACEYEKAKCTHRNLHVIEFKACPTPP